jgi:Cu(I)/Ag(I) efflux system membrane fusion protein
MEKVSTSKDESTKDHKPDTATVKGKVNLLMAEHGMINISRDAIKKWGRPAATLDFIADEDVSLIGINVNDEVEFTFEIHDGNFVITDITTLTPDMFNNKSDVNPSSVDH